MNRFAVFASLLLVFLFSTCSQRASAFPTRALPQAAAASAATVNVPVGTAIVAKLVAVLDTSQCKPGDRVEAEITHDVKVGHDTILKHGGHVIGKVAKVAAPDANGQSSVWIEFDSVAAKNAEPATLHLDVQAISKPETGDETALGSGPGIPQPPDRANEGPHGELTTASTGVVNAPNLTFANGTANGVPVTQLTSTKGNLRLSKGAQIVFRVVTP